MDVQAPAGEELSSGDLISLYELMVTGRTLETHLYNLSRSGDVIGRVLPGVGREATMVGIGAALDARDLLAGSARDLVMQLAKGVTLEACLASFFGKPDGPSRGRVGDGRFGVLENGTLVASSAPAAGLPAAVGCALAFRQQGTDRVVLVSDSERATTTATWHEALAVAVGRRLPIIFLVQNTQAAPAPPPEAPPGGERSDPMVQIPRLMIDGTDTVACYHAGREAVERARRGDGPTVIEAASLQFVEGGHDNLGDAVRAVAWDRDPIERFESLLIDMEVLDDAGVFRVAEEVSARIQGALDEVAARPDPDPSAIAEGLFAPSPASPPAPPDPSDGVSAERMTMVHAADTTIAEEMDRDERVVILGDPSGRLGGLVDRFGDERVVTMPLAAGAVGVAAGAALMGQRPIVQLGRGGLVFDDVEQLVDVAATYSWKTGSAVPMVVRSPMGAGMRAGPDASRSPEGMLAHHPGLKVVCPSNPANAKGMLLAAIRDPNPVVYLEHRKLAESSEAPVLAGDTTVPLGQARIAEEGSDVTVVAWSAMVPTALAAAQLLEADRLSVEVIDLQSIVPLDRETLAASIAKTSRLVIVQEDHPFASVASEIAAWAAAELFWDLDAAIVRVVPPHIPVPFAPALEDAYLPDVDAVASAVRRVTAA